MSKRIFVEKKSGFDVEAKGLLHDFRHTLMIIGLEALRVVNRYDIEGVTDDEYNAARTLVFSEPPVDYAFDEELQIAPDEKVIAYELLPGQYDQRADSAAVCVQIITRGEKPIVRAAKLIIFKGDVSAEDMERMKKYVINPVEAHEAEMSKPDSLVMRGEIPADVAEVEGFIDGGDEALEALAAKMGFAMDLDDLKFCREYFKNTEHRNPTFTEMRVIDTYWSDHCRHTTFTTIFDKVDIDDGFDALKASFNHYLDARKTLYVNKKKNMCLMDLATIAMKELKAAGKLQDLDESEEINACSINITADIDGKPESWLVMFKNETHNHPTEIEPFGGAATCLGGAIRDPLSGRSYVYQAMRVTGSGDPRTEVKDTLPGKLSQRKITRTAAAGYSSYGNQIGLATGQVAEVYHPGYVAKRMEIGAVVGATPKDHVVRIAPEKGDIIILLGGRTGRDGCGGATGSSKAHNVNSLATCGAEVQKGNPPEERKLQRLFRNGDVTRMIKRCNDFGAGGVSVAIGELADGLDINLDAVPKKYEGLDGTELAISESQERMAVVIDAKDANRFIAEANKENLEATVVAVVTNLNRLRMTWRGKTIVDVSRDFLNTNGAEKHAHIHAQAPSEELFPKTMVIDLKSKWLDTLGDLNVCSQKGLSERFDSSIGAGSVLMPFGGKYQLTPAEGMAAKLPLSQGETTTATVMTYGYNPILTTKSPYHGAMYAVVESISKIAAMGGDYSKVRLTFQEYFERLGTDPTRWGKPFSALMGAYTAQLKIGTAAIGGKDSMSGSFGDMDVPPTLVSFAIVVENAAQVISPEFKQEGNYIVYLPLKRLADDTPDFDCLHKNYTAMYAAVKAGKVLSASAIKMGGICEAVSKMSFGNMIGANLSYDGDLFAPETGGLIVETEDKDLFDELGGIVIGTTGGSGLMVNGIEITLSEALEAWRAPLERIFPTKAREEDAKLTDYLYGKKSIYVAKNKVARPKVFIPVFPGTNCEYDSARQFIKAGADPEVCVFNNLSQTNVEYSLKVFAKKIGESQMIMFPGGFSGGDEPDGSGKFIAAAFRNPQVKDAVMTLLKERDGLILGICNGFQALIKLGLVPYGEIRDMDSQCPTLTFNNIGRHVSQMVYTKVVSKLSPWFSKVQLGSIHTIPVSHGEGRFVASPELVDKLRENGQVATRYVDINGMPTHDIAFNPNGSIDAIEGITSPDGRVLGKMGHSERKGDFVAKNIIGDKDQFIFESGVEYFK